VKTVFVAFMASRISVIRLFLVLLGASSCVLSSKSQKQGSYAPAADQGYPFAHTRSLALFVTYPHGLVCLRTWRFSEVSELAWALNQPPCRKKPADTES